MKKRLVFFLVVLLLCGSFACKTDKATVIGGMDQTYETVTSQLIGKGWTDKTGEIAELDPALETWFAWFTKDGQTLMIYFEDDFTRYGDEACPTAYVLYGSDGSVLEWEGLKPIDHAIVDSHMSQESICFKDLAGYYGLDVAEDDYVYLLDDGRIAIETLGHEDRNSDEDFRMIRVIP